MNVSNKPFSLSIFYGSVLLILCGLFRSTDLFFRIDVLSDIPVVVIVMWEHIICLCVLIPVLFKFRLQYRTLNRRDFSLFILIGCGSSALGIYFFTKAFGYINPALVILLQKLQPVITITLGVLILKERLTQKFYIFAPLAIVASYFVSFSTISPFTGEWHKAAAGFLYTLLAALFWGSGTVWGKMLLKSYNKNFILVNRFLIGAFFTFLMALFLTDNQPLLPAVFFEKGLLLKIVYMAIIPGLVATGFFYYGLNIVPASVTSILELVFPLSSVLIMWFFFSRPLDTVQIIASVILFISILGITKDTAFWQKKAPSK